MLGEGVMARDYHNGNDFDNDTVLGSFIDRASTLFLSYKNTRVSAERLKSQKNQV